MVIVFRGVRDSSWEVFKLFKRKGNLDLNINQNRHIEASYSDKSGMENISVRYGRQDILMQN